MTTINIFEDLAWNLIRNSTYVPSVPDLKWSKEKRSLWRGHSGLEELQPRPGGATKEGDRPLLYRTVDLIKPKVAFETGCYEAVSSTIICKALPPNAEFHTFDYDGDPSMPVFPVHPGDDYCTVEEWKELAGLRQSNLDDVRKLRRDIRIVFHDGDTRQILRDIVRVVCTANGPWEFWYQDSMHDLNGIRAEFEAMERWAAPSAVVIFDDIEENDFVKNPRAESHPWFNYFVKTYGHTWNYRTTSHANHQLFIQKK